MPQKVAILDIDGTLVDTNYQHAVAWYRAFRQHGVVLPVWRIHRHIGMGGDQLVESLTDASTEEEKGDDIRGAEKALYLALILVCDYVFNGTTATVVAVVAGAAFAWFWFLAPLLRRNREQSGS